MNQPPNGPPGPYGYGPPPPQQQGYYPPQQGYYQQPPTVIVNNQGSGCLKAILIVFAIIVLGNVATCATCAMMADSGSHK